MTTIKELMETLTKANTSENIINELTDLCDCSRNNLVENITNLVNNTEITNISKLEKELKEIAYLVDEAVSSYSSHYDSVMDATSYLDEIGSESDELYDLQSSIESLQERLQKLAEPEVEEGKATEGDAPVSEMGESVSDTNQENNTQPQQ